MNQVISQILQKNEPDLVRKKQELNVTEMEEKIAGLEKPRQFLESLLKGFENHGMGLIAEIKLASPSENHLGDQADVLRRVKEYETSGANAISVITEKYFFKGNIGLLKEVKSAVNLAVLQKDFVVDPIQIYESRLSGADALLLITKIISPDQLNKFVEHCFSVGLEPVVEINDELDLENALKTETKVIAVNARDLDTLVVDVDKACALMKKIPDKFFKLGFSGIKSAQEVKKYKQAGAKAVLVGTNLMKTENISQFIRGIRDVS